MIVAVDLDGVLNNIWATWYARHNRSCTTCTKPLETKDIVTWDIHLYCECGKDIYTYLDSEAIYRNAPVVDDAIYGTLALQEMGLDLYVLTHSFYTSAIIGKMDFMKQHFPHISFDRVVHMKDKHLFRAAFLIDDCIRNFAHTNGIVPVLFNQAHNQEIHFSEAEHTIRLTKSVERVYGWRDIVERFKIWTQ